MGVVSRKEKVQRAQKMEWSTLSVPQPQMRGRCLRTETGKNVEVTCQLAFQQCEGKEKRKL